MLKSLLYIIILCIASVLYSNIVINELLYDPVGDDTGYEWLELYNNGDTDINLEGAKIQVAGATFIDKFTFPHYILRAHRYVLIGEANVTQAIFTATLVMQNGETGTDGIRYVSPDGNYTDTVLYDSPNVNNLTDDNGNMGITFAPDVQAGYSLARGVNGLDTGDCEYDFLHEINPTPGLPNHVPIDYSLGATELNYSDGIYTLTTDIYNLSMANDNSVSISLNVSLNELLLHSFDIEPLEAGNSTVFSAAIDITTQSCGILKVELVIDNDINTADNLWLKQLGGFQEVSLCINEILYNPEAGNQEWIELFIPPFVLDSNELTISDASENSIQINLPQLCPNYLVICKDQDLLLSRYPDCPPGSILEVSSLPVMNNEGDILVIRDVNHTTIDSMSYTGNSGKKGLSLERQVSEDSTITWQYCYDSDKGTPGEANSDAPPPSSLDYGQIKLLCSPFNPLNNEKMHLQYNFRDASNTMNCYLYDLHGIKRYTVASGLKVGSSGEIVWNGKDKQGKPFPRGIYVLLVEAKNSSNKYFLKKQLTVVLATK